MDPNIPSSTCVLEEDPFMAVYENASSPYLLASENQHGVVSLLNITSALTPLNTSTLISDLSPFPQPITPTVVNNGETPMPSPVKTHGEVCNDFFCSTHGGADIATVNQTSTAVSSYQFSSAPLIRCRGKKRVRNYDDWEEIKRKRLANAGKEYISKKGVIVQAKTIVNNKVTWTSIKEVCVDGTQSSKIRYKYALSDDYMTLVLRKETRQYNNPILHKAYVGPIPISNDKYKDLISLCDSPIIPTKYHNYFRSLPHGRNVSDTRNNNESD
ncbi:unnamed protein product [Parnassius apollo]|uniref:(apollo) hypothetical protein n=1 Tax=Parnassius apollo TaxID=110799 RepID=A0A8S3XL27_PARAO|nr:unnamed protein product [Parnassius apollo]